MKTETSKAQIKCFERLYQRYRAEGLGESRAAYFAAGNAQARADVAREVMSYKTKAERRAFFYGPTSALGQA